MSETTNTENTTPAEPETTTLTQDERYEGVVPVSCISMYNNDGVFADEISVTLTRGGRVAFTPTRIFRPYNNETVTTRHLPTYQTVVEWVAESIRTRGITLYYSVDDDHSWKNYFFHKGEALNAAGIFILPRHRERILRTDPIMKRVLREQIRRIEVEEFVVHQKSIVDNLSITAEQKELYTLLLLQWCIAAQDDYNVADGSNWTILQKCMAYSIKDFVKDKNQTQIWNNITKADLVPPILAGQDWLGKYPINPDSTYNLVGTTGNSFLRNAGDLYDINSNYAKALRILEYGEVKKLSERY